MTDRTNPPSRTGAAWRNLALFMYWASLILAWLPFIRALMDGAAYEWSAPFYGFQARGAGLEGDFWVVALQAGLGLLLLYLGLRHPGRVSYWLLCVVLAFYAGSWLYLYIQDPEGLIFRGDTLGVEINPGLSVFLYYAFALACALLGARFEFALDRPRPVFAWTRTNSVLLAVALALAPAQFFLLRYGPQHGPNDAIGVYLTMAQWILILFALSANRKRGRKLARS